VTDASVCLLNHLCGPSLKLLQYAHVSLAVVSSALGTAHQVSHQCWVEAKDYLLATLCLIQPRMLLVSVQGHIAGSSLISCSPGPQAFLCKAALQLCVLISSVCWVYSSPDEGLCVSLLLGFMMFCFDQFWSLSRFPWQAVRAPGASVIPSSFVSSANMLRVHSVPSSRLWKKMLNSTGSSADPWGAPLLTVLQLDFVPLITVLWT